MLNDQELGELVVKIQTDDVRPRELREFLLAVTQDAEMRRNLKLAGKVSHLERGVRERNCTANFLYLLSHSTLSPEGPPKRTPNLSTTRAFAEKFGIATIGAWKDHVNKSVTSSTPDPKNKKGPNKPNLVISSELHVLLAALEEFWDVRGLYLSS